MKTINLIFAAVALIGWTSSALAQAERPGRTVLMTQAPTNAPEQSAGNSAAVLDTEQEKRTLQVFLRLGEKIIVPAAEAMPADKYGFAPTDGEFKGVRTFAQQVKHLAAANYILAAAAMGQDPPADAGDEAGPESVRTKAEILDYLKGSFTRLGKATNAIGDKNVKVKSSPISPLKGSEATRLALVMEALIHTFDHYGQMVEYLRMNGVVPPASRP